MLHGRSVVFVGKEFPAAYTGTEVIELNQFGLFRQQCRDVDEPVTATRVRAHTGQLVDLGDTDTSAQ